MMIAELWLRKSLILCQNENTIQILCFYVLPGFVRKTDGTAY